MSEAIHHPGAAMGPTRENATYGNTIALTVLSEMPSHLLVIPQADDSGSSKNVTSRVMAVGPRNFDAEVLKKVVRSEHPEDSLSRIFFDLQDGSTPESFSSWDGIRISYEDLLENIVEMTLQSIGEIWGAPRVNSRFPAVRLFRQVWETMEGKLPRQPVSERAGNQFQDFIQARRDCTIETTKWFRTQTGIGRSILLSGCRSKFMQAFVLCDSFQPQTICGQDVMVRGKDMDLSYRIPNPFYQTSLRACTGFQLALSDGGKGCGAVHDDLAFSDLLKRNKTLLGRGIYGDYSIKYVEDLPGRGSARLCLDLGKRPFLQQMTNNEVFVFYDLRKYPVTLFMQQEIGSNKEMDILESPIFVFSGHPSFNFHPFVKGSNGKPFTGTICTESTRQRLFSIQSDKNTLHPALFMLEQLRSAARILRFGLRARDRLIHQHNPFGKVPYTMYQAVIEGRDSAQTFAAKNDAEIIYYSR